MKTRTIIATVLLGVLMTPVPAIAEPTTSPAPTASSTPAASPTAPVQPPTPPAPVQPPVPPTTSLPLPQDAQDDLDEMEAQIRGTLITPEMRDVATLTLDWDSAALPLNPEPATIPVQTQSKADTGDTTISLVSDILFDFGSYELTPAAQTAIPDILKDIPQGIPVAVNGYTDSIGTDADNLVLSQQRAQAVADVVSQARPDLKLTVTGYGETNPVAPNTNSDGSDNPIGRSQNRRVEIVYHG